MKRKLPVKPNGKIRKKKRIGNSEAFKTENCSIKLRNLPFSIKEKEIKAHFKQFGGINNVVLMKKKKGKLTGNAFVHFKSADAAEAAAKQSSEMDIKGRKVSIEFVKSQQRDSENGLNIIKTEEREFDIENVESWIKEEKNEDHSQVKEEEAASVHEGSCATHGRGRPFVESSHHEDKMFSVRETKERIENSIPTANTKRGRIIVRNLSFKTTEEKLRDHFKDFGAISELTLLRRENGMLVGCGFVQFENKKSAIKAILGTSGRPFLGRPIVCDWALPKDKFLHQNKTVNESNDYDEENGEKDRYFCEMKIKEEPQSEESDFETQVKEEAGEIREEHDEEEEEEDYDDEDDDMKDGDGDFENPSDSSIKYTSDSGETEKKTKLISNDVSEGCTLFVKNIPFTATNQDMQEHFKQFGPLHYAIICIDKLTEHSKGTGFVKFKEKSVAERCLQTPNQTIKNQNILVMKALPRNEIISMQEKKKEKPPKDKRHLYLMKEGVILANSPAAKGVSVTDMEKRHQIEQWKIQMLRNVNMFISNTRMIIYNIPPSWTDKQVRELFRKNGGPGAVIREARIMRDMKDVDANGIGKSKEYAFVRFVEPEHALRALRNINNNPKIFSEAKRPIVTFSIENKSILNIKKKRMEKSRLVNAEKQRASQGHKVSPKKQTENKQRPKEDRKVEVESNQFSGLEGKQGNIKLRKKYSMKMQVTEHAKAVKKERRKQWRLNLIKQRRKEKASNPYQPQRRKVKEVDGFSKLVDKYKQQLQAADSKKRWFEYGE